MWAHHRKLCLDLEMCGLMTLSFFFAFCLISFQLTAVSTPTDWLGQVESWQANKQRRVLRFFQFMGIFRNGNRLSVTGAGNRNNAGGHNKNSLVPVTASGRP